MKESEKLNVQKAKIMALEGMAIRRGKKGNIDRFYFWGVPKSLQMVLAAIKLKDPYSLEGKL